MMFTSKQFSGNTRVEWQRGLLFALMLFLLAYSWMFEKITVPNERSRVYLAVALVDDGTLTIDNSIRRFGATSDVARHEKHFYTDKAPGSSLVGAGLYALVRLYTKSSDWTIEELINLMRTWLMIPIGLLSFIGLHRFLGNLKIDSRVVDLVTFGWILASPAFHYSTAYYGHQIVAISILAALYLLTQYKSITGRFVAGAVTGLAGLTEYQVIISCFFIMLYVFYTDRKSKSRICAFMLGAAPFAILLFAYNWLAFGGPFALSYDFLTTHAMQVQHNQGIGGVTYPKPEAVRGVLFSLHRGILFTSPLFILVPYGLLQMGRKKQKALSLLIGGIFFVYLFFVLSADVWHGAWSFGLRLLVPALACASIPVAFAVDKLKNNAVLLGLSVGAILVSFFYHQVVHLVFPELPETVKNPLFDLIFPAMDKGIFSPNLFSKITGTPGKWTILPAVGSIAVAALLFIGRGWALQKRYGSKLISIAATVCVIAGFIFMVFQAGPTWPEQKRKRFINMMKRWEKIEFADPQKGRRRASKVD
jgi:hypothetical protein